MKSNRIIKIHRMFKNNIWQVTMNKRFEIFMFIIPFYLICSLVVNGSEYEVNTNAQSFIFEKLKHTISFFLGQLIESHLFSSFCRGLFRHCMRLV